jgi:etoposide-induced 2.4 mRNA
MYKSFLLNMLSLTSIYTFELVLEPVFRDEERWLHRNIGWFYHIMWLLPVLGASFYFNVRTLLMFRCVFRTHVTL